MKNSKYRKIIFSLSLSLAVLTGACDSNLSFNASREDSTSPPLIAANLTPSAAGNTIRIPDIRNIPESLRQADDIEVAFDNSESTVPVTRNTDGSLSFTAGNGLKIDSSGRFNVIFIADSTSSYLMTINTGPVLKLNNPAINITPATGTVIRGERVRLAANTAEDPGKFTFNWFFGANPSGPFSPISGTSSTVEWTPPSVGNYFVRLEMIDKTTGISSTYNSPVSLVFVTDANNIISVNPSSFLRGNNAALTANIPDANAENYQFSWAYSQSPNGPFQSISGNTKTVNWTPNSSGSFYIRVEALNKQNNQTSTYTSTEPLAFITENENIIATTPASGSVIRGGILELEANVPVTGNDLGYSWSYSPSPSGPWQVIPGNGKKVNWTPNASGTFYVKVDVENRQTNTVSTFVSPKAIAFVTEASNVFSTTPVVANVKRGKIVDISANIPGASDRSLDYNWSYSQTQQGPFLPMENIYKDSTNSRISWRPPTKGSFYVKIDAVDVNNGAVLTFVSPNPLVFVHEQTPLFTTNPEIARITRNSDVRITVDLDTTASPVFAWSYGPSTAGPWFSIGGTTTNTINWDADNKPAGTYYVKVDLTNTVTNTVSTFISSTPIIFIDTNSTEQPTFGTNSKK